MFAISIETFFKKLKYIFLKKKKFFFFVVFLLFTVIVFMNMKKIFKEEESIEILEVLGLTDNIEEHSRIYSQVWRKYKSRI